MLCIDVRFVHEGSFLDLACARMGSVLIHDKDVIKGTQKGCDGSAKLHFLTRRDGLWFVVVPFLIVPP